MVLFESSSINRNGNPTEVAISRGVFNATFEVQPDQYYHFEIFNTRQDITDPEFFENLSSDELDDYDSPILSRRATTEVQYFGEQGSSLCVDFRMRVIVTETEAGAALF